MLTSCRHCSFRIAACFRNIACLRRGARATRTAFSLGLLLGISLGGPAVYALPSDEDSGSEADGKKAPLPLAEAADLRSLQFSTDEVTWMSVDVTPDGKTLMVDVLGDLYTLPVAGGAATRLTEGLAFDSQPAVSPDGSAVAFVSDRDGADNIWILPLDGSADGEPRQLTKDKTTDFMSPAWSADSQYVIYSKAGKGMRTYELWMSHRDGGTGVQITQAQPTPTTPRDRHHNAAGAAASADGRYLYYARKFGGFSYNAEFPMWQIARRDLIDGTEDVLTSAQGSGVRPVVSPDGTTLIYGTRFDGATGLKVRDLATGNERWLRYPVTRDDQESRATRDLLPGYDFSPDGASIYASWDGKLWKLDLATGEAEAIPFTVEVDQSMGQLLDFPRRVEEGPVRARTVQGAEESTDGRSVVFSALTRVYVTDRGAADGATARRLSPAGDRAFQPTFSPDGDWVVYVTWGRDGGHVWKVPTSGGSPTRLTADAAFYAEPSISPNGERVVFRRGSRSDRLFMPAEFGGSPMVLDLAWVPFDSGAGGPSAAQLIAPSRGLARPHFGPEDDRVYVASSEGLVSMRYDGSDKRVHLEVKGPGLYFASEPVPASDLRIRPDGSWAIAQVSNRFYAVALPRIGGTATVNVATPSVPVKELSHLGADGMTWTRDGSGIGWTVGPVYFRTAFDDLEFRSPDSEAGEAGGDESGGEESGEAKAPSFPDAERTELVAELPRAEPDGSVVLRGARVFTMSRSDDAAAPDGGVVENADVVVTGRRIVAVGTTGTVDVPRTAQIIDVSGKAIVPGFIDTHAHWTEIRRNVLDVESWPFLANLAWGVTTGLDVQTATNDMFAYQDLIDAGEVLGPRAYSTGPGIFSDNDFQTKEQVEGVLRRYRDQYGTYNLKAYISGNRKQRHWIAQVAKELEMMVTTEGALDFKLDLTHALDGLTGTEHSLPLVPLYRDTVELMVQSGMAYTPTLLVAYGGPWAENHFYTEGDVHGNQKLRRFMPHDLIDGVTRKRAWFRADEHVYDELAAAATEILRAGGRVGVGAHGQLQGLGYHWEMQAFAAGGMEPLEVLHIATLGGAEIIGLAQDLGSLEPGKIADLVVIDGDPRQSVDELEKVTMVMKNGSLYDAATLDEVWPEQTPLPEQWWWSAWPEVAATSPR